MSPAKWLELIMASMIRLYGSRQKEIYVDFFGFLISLEDVTDDRLDKELSTHTHTHIYMLSEI